MTTHSRVKFLPHVSWFCGDGGTHMPLKLQCADQLSIDYTLYVLLCSRVSKANFRSHLSNLLSRVCMYTLSSAGHKYKSADGVANNAALPCDKPVNYTGAVTHATRINEAPFTVTSRTSFFAFDADITTSRQSEVSTAELSHVIFMCARAVFVLMVGSPSNLFMRLSARKAHQRTALKPFCLVSSRTDGLKAKRTSLFLFIKLRAVW